MSIVEYQISQAARQPRTLNVRKLLVDALKTTALSCVLFAITVHFVARAYHVYGSCMDPNIRNGERLVGSKLAYALRKPARGDIIVFRSPQDGHSVYIKRVIALPGETVEIRDGVVLVDGHALREPYLHHVPHGTWPAVAVEPNCLYVMGDYRDQSNDSRFWGQLPISDIQAKVWARYWPASRASVLD